MASKINIKKRLWFENKSVFICSDGGPELSTGGTGDVLAGVISSLVAQNLDIVDACLLSVAAHAKAGELFVNDVGEIGLNASSLIPIIRDLINKWIQYFLKMIQTRAN